MSEVILPGFEMSGQVTANSCFSLPCMEEETVWIFNIIDTGSLKTLVFCFLFSNYVLGEKV